MTDFGAPVILDCGHPPTLRVGSPGTGIGITDDGKKLCYDCCASLDKQQMLTEGRITLYLTISPGPHPPKITNWPGTLTFFPYRTKQTKGFGLGRTYPIVHAWFFGPDGKPWFGRHAGNHNQLIRCRRLRSPRS